MDNDRYTDKVLRYLMTAEGLYHMPSAEFLSETLTDERFVIFFYMLGLGEKNIRLTEEFLQAGLKTNKSEWVNERSVFMRNNPQITKDYLQSKVKTRLDSKTDYSNALEAITLARFKKIKEMEVMEEKEFIEMIIRLKEIASPIFAKKVAMEIVPLVSGEQECIYHEGIRYNKPDSIQYMAMRSQQLNYKLATDTQRVLDKYSVWERTSRSASGVVPTFIWNLGKSIFSNPFPGNLISIIAPKKVGKTRFMSGEIAYPSILLKRNVKIFSGEMQEHEVRAMLVTKHIMYTKGYKIKGATVEKVMVTAARVRTKRADEVDLLYFSKVPGNIKEAIFQAENDLFYSGRYGNLSVVFAGDLNRGHSMKTPGEFLIEHQHNILRKESESLPEGEKWDVVVQDHVNHMDSERNLHDSARIEEYIQSAKTFATADETKCVYVIINHLNTEQEKKLKEQDSAEGMMLRGHGSNESGKSADLEYVMYQTSIDEKEGTIRVCCTADRRKNISEIYKTDTFILKADRGNCDFAFEGVGVKAPYPTVDQLKQIEEMMMSSH